MLLIGFIESTVLPKTRRAAGSPLTCCRVISVLQVAPQRIVYFGGLAVGKHGSILCAALYIRHNPALCAHDLHGVKELYEFTYLE